MTSLEQQLHQALLASASDDYRDYADILSYSDDYDELVDWDHIAPRYLPMTTGNSLHYADNTWLLVTQDKLPGIGG